MRILDNVLSDKDNVQITIKAIAFLQVVLGYVAHDRQRCNKFCRNQEILIQSGGYEAKGTYQSIGAQRVHIR